MLAMRLYINSANHCHLGYNTACLFLPPVTGSCHISSPNPVFGSSDKTKNFAETWKKLTTCREASQNGEAKARRRKLQLQEQISQSTEHVDMAYKDQSAFGSVSMQR